MAKKTGNTHTESQQVNSWLQLFEVLLQESDFALDQYVNGHQVSVEQDSSDIFINSLKQFLDSAADIIGLAEDQDIVWGKIEKIGDEGENKKFIQWLKEYVGVRLRPRRDAEFINKMEQEDFENISRFCFENYVLQKTNLNYGDRWTDKQIVVVRKMIFTFVEMLVVDFLSDEYAVAQMKSIFAMEKGRCDIWLRYIKQNEDRLWKIMLMRRMARIEKKMDNLEVVI